MSQPKQTLNLYEYSKGYFDDALSEHDARDLHLRCNELQKHSNGEVLSPLYNSHNQTVGVESRQFVGVVRVNAALTIQILPKMSKAQDGSIIARQQSIANLLYMLNYCGKLVSTDNRATSIKKFNGDFYEILIHLYASTLLNEIRNNLHHEYVSSDQNLPYMRGKLLFNEHLRVNGITQDKFYIHTDDFTPDTQLNQIFAYVSQCLLKSSTHRENKRLLGELVLMLDEVTLSHKYLHDATSIQLSRLNKRFAPALELAKLFLSGQSLMLSHDSFTTTTFLIDMNVLFEDFIATILKKATDSETIVYTQGPKQYFVSGQTGSEDDRPLFMMKPDISIAKRQAPKQLTCIIDTKYKLLTEAERKMGVSQPDLYQMYAYAGKYKTKNITLLYPLRPDQAPIDRALHIDADCTVRIATVDLTRDLKLVRMQLQNEIVSLIEEPKLSFT